MIELKEMDPLSRLRIRVVRTAYTITLIFSFGKVAFWFSRIDCTMGWDVASTGSALNVCSGISETRGSAASWF